MQQAINQASAPVLKNAASKPAKRGFSWFGRGTKTPASPSQAGAPVQKKNQAAPIVHPPVHLATALHQQAPSQAGRVTFVGALTALFHNLYTWQWTKSLVYWLIISAGTASELAFLVSSLWMSVNANVHPFIRTIMSEKSADYLTYLATICYVSLPIFIVGLATIQTVQQAKMCRIHKMAIVWVILFGLPAFTFLTMDMFTIGSAVANVAFKMPTPFVVLRALSAFTFAFSSFLYNGLGKPSERERLAEKDGLIAGLKAEMERKLVSLRKEKDTMLAELRAEKDGLIATFTSEKANILALSSQEKERLISTIDAKNDEIESLKSLLTHTQKGFSELHKAMNQSEDAALEAFGEECLSWLRSGIKSATIETITRYTGLTSTKVFNAFTRGEVRKAPNSKRTKEDVLLLISSLVPWLKSLASERKTEGNLPALQLVRNQ